MVGIFVFKVKLIKSSLSGLASGLSHSKGPTIYQVEEIQLMNSLSWEVYGTKDNMKLFLITQICVQIYLLLEIDSVHISVFAVKRTYFFNPVLRY